MMTNEKGDIIAGSLTDNWQSVLLAHANYGKGQLTKVLAYSLLKAGLAKCNIDVYNPYDVVNTSGRTLTFYIAYKTTPTALTFSFVNTIITDTTTFQAVANDLETKILTITGTNTTPILCQLRIEYSLVATPAIPAAQIALLDLKRTKVELYSKSSFKMQNRSVTVAGDNEADDVDNVPLYGKQYDGAGNYFYAGDIYYLAGTGDLFNSRTEGCPPSSLLVEPQPLSVIKRAKTIGKLLMEPGAVKTSVLTDRRSMNINILIKMLCRYTVDNIVPIGKFRLFHLEKMLQTVATTTANAIKIAHETDIKYGMIVTMPKFVSTVSVWSGTPL